MWGIKSGGNAQRIAIMDMAKKLLQSLKTISHPKRLSCRPAATEKNNAKKLCKHMTQTFNKVALLKHAQFVVPCLLLPVAPP